MSYRYGIGFSLNGPTFLVAKAAGSTKPLVKPYPVREYSSWEHDERILRPVYAIIVNPRETELLLRPDEAMAYVGNAIDGEFASVNTVEQFTGRAAS